MVEEDMVEDITVEDIEAAAVDEVFEVVVAEDGGVVLVGGEDGDPILSF